MRKTLILFILAGLLNAQQDNMFDILNKQEQRYLIKQEINELKNKKIIKEEVLKQEQIKEDKVFFFKKTFAINEDSLAKDLNKYLKKYDNSFLTYNLIFELIKDANNYIIKKGFSNSIVDIAEFSNQELKLVIRYAYINDIYLNEKKYPLQIKLASPLAKNDIFNIYDFDTAIENLKNGTKEFSSSIKASSKDGYSDIFITRKIKKLAFIASLDNSADKNTGEYKANTHLIINNPFNLNDTLRFSFIKTLLKKSSDKANLYVAGYNIALQNYKLSYSLQYSDNKNMLNDDLANKSKSLKHKISLSRIIYRNNIDKLSAYVDLNLKDNTNKINDIKLELSSKKYSNIATGINYSSIIFNGYLFFNLEYQKGLAIFGAKKDYDSLYTSLFNKINTNISYQKNYFLSENNSLSFESNFYASYSKDSLLNADKMLVGDEYSVRGFKQSQAAWDLGFYHNNTVYLNSNYLFNNFLPFLGLDYAYGRDYYLDNNDFLVGLAFGFKYSIKNFSFDLTMSKALHKSYNMPKENMPIYLKFSANL
ncbi:ShlB/FhaC/HecB family hemolysin secretion/activation protein [Campylobacter canadensis]|uniref:ShlB/FhaC/HecB family hemolysin secretion/activation protein n=1 Tax=Campylobacter canadensis TaxID=449520 RepID=UPI001CCB627D|nr:ShlB/FhaC/HecB family hemolysin secretion/activation protein [Campylobacter canadensis]